MWYNISGDFMTINNPFFYSDDNKRYHTWNYACRHRYQSKVYKVALNASFTCPNRDGTCGTGGCVFCSEMGSGEFAGDKNLDLMKQLDEGILQLHQKWPDAKAMAYFQSFSNTYAPLATLQAMYDPIFQRDDICAVCIATRADCLEDDKIAYFQSLTKNKDIWIELGLQSIHDETTKRLNRGHTYATFADCVQRLRNTNLKICVHIINSLPMENDEMMMDTIKAIASLPIHAVKIHMLHVMKHTTLATQYEQHPFPLMERDAYIDLVIRQLEVLPPHIIVQRLTGDAPKDSLIAPIWTRNKTILLNKIDQEMVRRNTWQGKKIG